VKPLYMLDTNICIYIIKHKPPEIKARFQRYKPGQIVISTVTYAELWFGAQRSAERQRALALLQAFVRDIPVAPLGSKVGEAYGEIRARLERKGRLIGNNDLWIGAHAAVLDVTLATNNEREFKRIDGLSVENWAK
jgi:tRNA(fMet)-specific endonuclease VapC